MLFALFALFKNFVAFWFARIIHLKQIDDSPIPEPEPETEIDAYIRTRQTAFIHTYNTPDDPHNVNMTPVFYDRAALSRAIADPDRELERQWRARILYESTPIGNIMMYYDIFKDSFAYYCDSVASAKYDILNAVAMKYVTMFRCRDLFIDTIIPPRESPLSAVSADELRSENDKKRTALNKVAKTSITAINSPFVKFRSYNKNNSLVPLSAASAMAACPRDNTAAAETPATIAVKNRFVYIGRTQDIRILQGARTHRVPHAVSYAQFKRNTATLLSADLAQ